MVATKRFWSAFLALVLALTTLGLASSAAASTNNTDSSTQPEGKYYAKDDVVTKKFYFFADPFERSPGTGLRSEDLDDKGRYKYATQYDVTRRYRPQIYHIYPFDNDVVGYDSYKEFDYRGKHGLADIVTRPKKGELYRSLGCFESVCSNALSYIATSEGADSIGYSVKDVDGGVHAAKISGIRNVNVRNVRATATVGGVRFYNPNSFKIRVNVGPRGFYPTDEELSIPPRSYRTFRPAKADREYYRGGVVDYRTVISRNGPSSSMSRMPAVTFRLKMLTPKSKPSVKTYSRGGYTRVYLVGSKEAAFYFTVKSKRLGSKSYKTVKYKVGRGSSRSVNLGRLARGSSIVVKAGVRVNKLYVVDRLRV